MPPVDPFEQHRQLCRGQHRDPFGGRRPSEATTLKTLGVKHETLPVPPQQLDQITPLAPERIDRAAERITLQMLLNECCQPVEPFAHIGNPGGQIDLGPSRRTNHVNPASTAFSTRASIGGVRRTT